MNQGKILAVVIPTKNRSQHLSKSVNCFSEYTDRLQVIVVDDGSDEEHASFNQEITQRVGGYFRLRSSRGGSAARNFGADRSDSPYIWFFDDDDMVEGATIDRVLETLSFNTDADVVLLPMEIINGATSERVVIPEPRLNNFETYRDQFHQVNTSCTIIKRDAFLEAGRWDEKLVAAQDTDLFLRLSRFSKYLCLDALPVKVFVAHSDRVTTNTKKQRKAIVQFVRKHWGVLTYRRKMVYGIAYIRTFPLIIKIGRIVLMR